MAGALVGGSFLSAFLQVLFDRMTSPKFVGFFKAKKLNNGLLKKLNATMICVNGFLDDAEEKQISNPAIKKWLDELKDAVYDADDLFDEITCEALRLELEDPSQTSINQAFRFISSFNPFKKGLQLEEKLVEILDRLEYLVKLKDAFGLKEGIGENPSLQKTPTTCLVNEFGVYGRDDDKEAIMELVLSNGSELGVIPIVGMGGIGKTTLAQLVYNDSRAQQWFDIKAWVFVSEEFNVSKITKDVIEEVTGKICDSRNLNQLQLDLKERLKENRFFLVLDDVWNEKHADWDILLRPLKFGAQGSKIIVTTRNESVASLVQTFPSYHLKELMNDDCWFLFARHAFDGGNSVSHPQLEEIGRKIVEMCKGLPLAVKTLGGVLRSNRDINEWKKILTSKMWFLSKGDILPALRLSYQYLPSHLKRCFAYCSLFPKDYEFKKKELVLLWMAEGFIVQSHGNKDMEVGGAYFDDLVSRSFFQESNGHQSCFVMHDLISDLAKFVGKEFCFWLEGENPCTVAKKTRHFSYVRTRNDTSRKFGYICEARFLRTFLPMEHSLSKRWLPSTISDEVVHDLLPKLEYLRVLSLTQYGNIIRLTDSIGDLKHLRYLNLSGASLERLPESLGSLYNLQTLILHRCRNFVQLPSTLGKLLNMCHLDIRKTNLKEMPPQMGKLKNLQILTNFVLGEHGGSRIKELGNLQHIQGTLDIYNLQYVVVYEDALEANLKDKEQLKKLKLTWNGSCKDSLHERGVLEQLQPHKKVEGLSITGYGGTRFPNWVGESSFSDLVELMLSGCKNCSFLPPLGQLASLRFLLIEEFDGIEIIGPEFYGSIKNPFRSLETLIFQKMALWREWISDLDKNEGEAFPLLQQLCIRMCPNLTKALPSYLSSLTSLEIRECQQLVASVSKATTICGLEVIEKSRALLRLEQLPSGLFSLLSDECCLLFFKESVSLREREKKMKGANYFCIEKYVA
ncbi:hypothetical protein JCGZ_15312 [Jatropha curcas]|uniref:Disease resistance RPP13-like protein 1 n=1 Tax=Jatropha curcas TaxID=180498 RepID=A0A067LF62_JATCU|nr:hypothetical protein JCGZ_15312 [Jatropha curcas]